MHPLNITALDVAAWAERIDAQATLPRLVRQLIRASGAEFQKLLFPADEGTQLGGWDGIVVAPTGNEMVPDGQSAWELSTSSDPKRKAEKDFQKRSADPEGLAQAETVYVCLTAQSWPGKEKWRREKEAVGIWRGVRAYDAEDLASWLEAAPAVQTWFARIIGKQLDGIRDFATEWAEWSESTEPPMIPELIIGGRQEYVQQIYNWLSSPPSAFALQTDSRDEAIAFFLAAVEKLPEEERVQVLSRALVVTDARNWPRLVVSARPLVLVPAFEENETVDQATRKGHHVFIPLGREHYDITDIVELPRISRSAVEAALTQIGIADDRASSLATLARRSFLSFRRRLSRIPTLQRPRWSAPEAGTTIIPAMLAGTWRDDAEGDRDALSTLSQKTYDVYVRALVRWANESDPPVRKVGNSWLLNSKEDAWRLLARYVTSQDLERLEQVVVQCLGTYDPAFELAPSERYMARILGHSPQYSGLLSKGLADTLALMGARGRKVRIGESLTASDHAAIIVRRVLEMANQDWRLWASLEGVLPLLAEAAPEIFLDAVDSGLKGDDPVIMRLFAEDGEGVFGPRSYHSGLLWALERLAWSPDYLGRTALTLAKLARLDPGGRLSNRPQNSLEGIFRLWYPQTTATPDRRERVLSVVAEREPEVGWSLLCNLLPERRGFAIPSAKPSWREWIADESPVVTWGQIISGTVIITEKLLALVGVDGAKWGALIDSLADLPKEAHESVVNRLLRVRVTDFAHADRLVVWNSLRDFLAKHTEFSDAAWALPADFLKPIYHILKRFRPDDPVEKHEWLFSQHPTRIAPREEDWRIEAKKLAGARRRAVREIYDKRGLAGIRTLLYRIEAAYDLGQTVGRGGLVTEADEDMLLMEMLGGDDRKAAEFIRALVYWRFHSGGWGWVERTLSSGSWTKEQTAQMFASLPNDSEVWDRVEDAGVEVEGLYWTQVGIFYGLDDVNSLIRVISFLLKHGRPYTALQNIAGFAHDHKDVPSSLVLDVLEQAAHSDPSKERIFQSLGYQIGKLLDRIEESGDIEEQRVARLEWAYLPLFRYQSKRPPKVLYRELQRKPEFFAEVVSWAYKAEGELETAISEQDAAQAERAHQLLEDWHAIPGIQSDGSIDETVLREWVLNARAAVLARGRRVGDSLIGKILRYSPAGDDGAWPAVPVRAIIEELESEPLERGIAIEVYNSRGVTTRMPTDGGAQERALAERYLKYAEIVSDQWIRTASMLRKIAASYTADARREDTSAELTEDLWE